MLRLAHLAAAALAWLALSAPPATAQKVVRAVMDADLRFLDPISSPAYITRSVAHLIYDMRTVVGLGPFPISAPYGSNLRCMLSTGIPLFWNMDR